MDTLNQLEKDIEVKQRDISSLIEKIIQKQQIRNRKETDQRTLIESLSRMDISKDPPSKVSEQLRQAIKQDIQDSRDTKIEEMKKDGREHEKPAEQMRRVSMFDLIGGDNSIENNNSGFGMEEMGEDWDLPNQFLSSQLESYQHQSAKMETLSAEEERRVKRKENMELAQKKYQRYFQAGIAVFEKKIDPDTQSVSYVNLRNGDTLYEEPPHPFVFVSGVVDSATSTSHASRSK